MRGGLLAAALLACAACGGGNDSSPATVNGTINGQGMGAQDAVSNVLSAGTDSLGFIFVTNAANTCAKVSAGQIPRNGKAIAIFIGMQSASGISAPATTGPYSVLNPAAGSQTGNVALAVYQSVDASCTPNADLAATGGTVTLTRIDASGYAGTFDMTFSDNSHVTGNFTANKCSGLTQNMSGTCA